MGLLSPAATPLWDFAVAALLWSRDPSPGLQASPRALGCPPLGFGLPTLGWHCQGCWPCPPGTLWVGVSVSTSGPSHSWGKTLGRNDTHKQGGIHASSTEVLPRSRWVGGGVRAGAAGVTLGSEAQWCQRGWDEGGRVLLALQRWRPQVPAAEPGLCGVLGGRPAPLPGHSRFFPSLFAQKRWRERCPRWVLMEGAWARHTEGGARRCLRRCGRSLGSVALPRFLSSPSASAARATPCARWQVQSVHHPV